MTSTPTTSPPLRLGGTTRPELVLAAWNNDKRLRDKSPVQRAVAVGQRPVDLERKLTGLKAIVAESYADQTDAKALGDQAAKAHAGDALKQGFQDTDIVVRQLDAARTNANKVVAPLVSFYEGPSVDTSTGRRGAATAKPYTLLPAVKLSPSTTYGALALSKDEELANIDAQIARAETSLPDFVSAKKKVLAELDALADSGALTIARSGPFRGRLAWPKTNVNAEPLVNGFKPRVVDTSALFVRHFRKAVEAEALAALQEFYSGADVVAMTAQEKHNELRRLRSTRRAVERVRIEATWAAIANGEHVWHRADSDPWLLLGIEKPV